MSRLSFRPRPLDIYKKLPIVKSVKDLDGDDNTASRNLPQSSSNGADADSELVLSTPAKKGGGSGSEIPTPQFLVVDSYEQDYTSTFLQPPSYIRGRGARSEAAAYVEYDLDNEDEDWLLQLNNERKILSPERFERMLYQMETLDYKARERAGVTLPMLGSPMPVMLTRDATIEALPAQTSKIVVAAVYDYWKAKRDRWQKPVLRRLQPPPPVNDTNPFNVFRPREKAHRPHTRRTQRRENDVQSFDKLRQVRRNLGRVRGIVRAMQQREEKKRELVECEANMQRVQIRLKHDSLQVEKEESGGFTPHRIPSADEVAHNRLAGRGDQDNGVGCFDPSFDFVTSAMDGATMHEQMEARKRKRLAHPRNQPPRKRINAVDALEPSFLFTKPLDPEKLAAANISPWLDNNTQQRYHSRGRMGRGGRLIFDRWNPLTQTPLVSSSNFFSSLPFGPAVVDGFRASSRVLPPRLNVVDLDNPHAVKAHPPPPPPPPPPFCVDVPMPVPVQQPLNSTGV